MKFILTFFKVIIVFFFGSIILGRLFFPKLMQDYVISPIEKVPVLGQVLGITWDKSDEIMPILTQKTVHLADQVESSDLGINEAIENAASDQDLSQSIKNTINKVIQERVVQLKDLPAQTTQKAQEEIRREIYKQICSGWNESTQSGSQN